MFKSFRGAALALGVAVASLAAASQASAGVIFDLSPTNGTTFRTQDSGPGQGVDVASNVTITDMAFYANLPNGGDAKFMIWDGTNSTLLFSTTKSFGASNSQSWIHSGPINFNLVAGDRYWFGIIANNNIDVGYIYPNVAYSANGLTAVMTGNSNYSTFGSPTPVGNGLAEIGLQLSNGGAAPEPATWGLLLVGFGGLGAVLRRRREMTLA